MSAMRARLMMKVMGLIVLLVLTVVGAHSCSASSPTSPENPANLVQNGLAGVCANQQATNEALGNDQSPATAVSGSELSQLQASNPAGVQQLQQLTGGNLSCPTTTINGGGS